MAPNHRSQRTVHPPVRDAEPASRRGRGVAQYYRLYELLLAALQDGTLAPGSVLPSEPALCGQHGISRTTVRRALERLEQEGRILRRRGRGTYARPQRSPSRLCLALHALPETLAVLESRTTATMLRFAAAPVPAALRALAAEGIGATGYVLERLRCSQGEPVSLTVAYLPEIVGRRLRRWIPGRASIMTIVDRLGPPTAVVNWAVAAVAADIDAARALAVPLGAPLLRWRAALTDDAGGVRAVLESLCRSDRLQLEVLEKN
jgi:GntR family transcriptional regulator